MSKPTLMIFGLGNVGGQVLEFLARVPNLGWRVVAASRDSERGERKTRSAIFGASYMGLYPELSFRSADLDDIDHTAQVIAEEQPSIVVNAASFAAWWLRDLLPPQIRSDFQSVGPGLWSAAHMTPAHNIMRAIERNRSRPVFLNVSYPDLVNAALSRCGPGPAIGVGNIDLLVPAIQHVVAQRLSVPMQHVVPYVVAHNHHSFNILTKGTTAGVPFYLKIMVAGTDVSARFPLKELLQDVSHRSSIPTAAGASTLAAGSLCKVLLAVMTDSGTRSHVPGPNGLLGGYPATLGARGAELMLPADLPLAEAVAINEAGQRAEGVEKIESDGRVVFTEEAQRVLRERLRIRLASFVPSESHAVALRIDEALRALGARFGLRSWDRVSPPAPSSASR